MPEAAVNKNSYAKAWQHQVRLSGQVARVQTEAVPGPMQLTPHE